METEIEDYYRRAGRDIVKLSETGTFIRYAIVTLNDGFRDVWKRRKGIWAIDQKDLKIKEFANLPKVAKFVYSGEEQEAFILGNWKHLMGGIKLDSLNDLQIERFKSSIDEINAIHDLYNKSNYIRNNLSDIYNVAYRTYFKDKVFGLIKIEWK